VRRRQPGECVEQVGIGPDQDARLARLDAAVDDLGGLIRLRHRDRGELGDHLFVRAAPALGSLRNRALRTMLVLMPPG
jgi:hypothetical protein